MARGSKRSSSRRTHRAAATGTTRRRATSRSARRTPRSSAARSGRSSRTTTDHEQIRQWAEERGGRPACVRGTGGRGDTGMIRIEFPGAPGSRDRSLEEIGWDEFFEKFDDNGLALVYEETTSRGEKSNFNKLIGRETLASGGKPGRRRRRS